MIVPCNREMKRGSRGKDVLALQRALARAGYRRWGTFTMLFGVFTERQVRKFQAKHGIKPDGVYGQSTHRAMMKYFDAYGASLMASVKKPSSWREEICLQATILYNWASEVHYTQDQRRMMIVRYGIRKLVSWFRNGSSLWEDCSSSTTGLYFIVRLPDPNGRGYDGQGWTGTLSVRGKRVGTPVPGDLGFYGSSWPYHHVVMYLGNGLAFSHGSEEGPFILRPDYRGDFSHWRNYVA